MAIVNLTRLKHEDLTRGADVQRIPAAELLHALLGKPYKIAVMPMGIIGMTLKMSTNGLDTGFGVLVQVNPAFPVVCHS